MLVQKQLFSSCIYTVSELEKLEGKVYEKKNIVFSTE